MVVLDIRLFTSKFFRREMLIDPLRKVLCIILGSCALFFNLILVLIILSAKCVYIGKYKWLLFLYSLSAILNAIAELLTLTHLFMNPYGYIFYDSLHVLPPFISDGVLMIYASCFRQNLMLLTICFIYRYYAVCNLEKLACFLKNWFNIALICLAIESIEMSTLLYSQKRSNHYEKLMDGEFMNVTGYSLTETGYLAGIAFTEKGLNLKMLLVLWTYGMLSLVAGGIMVNLALKIAKILKANNTMSDTVSRLQKKIFSLLLIQVLLPFLFNICPQQILIFSLYFHIDSRDIIHLLCCCLTVAQVIDPLITLYLIKPYRIALLEIFRVTNSRASSEAVVSIT